MRKLLLIALICGNCVPSRSYPIREQFPAVVYNPWLSYVMLKWLTATNPQLTAQLLQSVPRGAPVEYHTLSGTAIHLTGMQPGRISNHRILIPTDNLINSQVSGQYKYDRFH